MTFPFPRSGGPADPSGRSDTSRVVAVLLAVIAFAGVARALALAWICDDAFISLRYAANLVAGEGLVYNAGEYVEGYTNLLWTLLIAAFVALGAPAVATAKLLGIAAYVGLASCLALWSWWRAREDGRPFVPFAAGAVLVMDDFHVWASGGLETMLYTVLAVQAAILARRAQGRAGPSLAAGVLLGALMLTRPDGLLIAGAVALSHLLPWDGRRGAVPQRLRAVLATAAPVALVLVFWVPFKLWYYGDVFPTAFYSKSVGDGYVSQGLLYVWLFLEKNWFVGAAIAAGLAVRCLVRPPEARDPRHDIAFLGTSLLFVAYLVHVGGDFMFARTLIPAVPLLLLAVEEQITRLSLRRAAAAAAVLLVAAVLRHPIYGPDELRIHGISDERRFYPESTIEKRRQQAELVSEAFAGTPVRVAFEGGMCVFGYYSELPYLVEFSGLTQYSLAKRPISERGYIGHEKSADDDWLADHDVHLLVRQEFPPLQLSRNPRMPNEVTIGGRVRARIILYSDAVMDALRGRADVEFTPIEQIVREQRWRIQQVPRPLAERIYADLERYYFRAAGDRGAAWARELRAIIDAKPSGD